MQSETSRIEAFSDGVFAIAITLLILEIKIPTPAKGSLAVALLQQWPSYLAFLMSFAFIGIMWINHHRLFTHIRRSNDVLLILNLLLLLGVTIVPFPTAVLAAYLGDRDQRVAAMLYNGTYFVIALLFNILWHYSVSRQLLDKSTLPFSQNISRQYALGPVMYLICLALAWFSVPASLAINGVLAIFFVLPPELLKKRNG
ncbi:MAG TPA: TMEM175 family protein [Terriglobales bacterium]|jgi:uncharacterized membrane protein|nr:TMEM175 family protein [Terriglobales bacterium]